MIRRPVSGPDQAKEETGRIFRPDSRREGPPLLSVSSQDPSPRTYFVAGRSLQENPAGPQETPSPARETRFTHISDEGGPTHPTEEPERTTAGPISTRGVVPLPEAKAGTAR